jgi:hypothetical protein
MWQLSWWQCQYHKPLRQPQGTLKGQAIQEHPTGSTTVSGNKQSLQSPTPSTCTALMVRGSLSRNCISCVHVTHRTLSQHEKNLHHGLSPAAVGHWQLMNTSSLLTASGR